MDRVRFEALLAAYGADPKRWPVAERPAAQAFARTPEAQSVIAEALSTDALLNAGRGDAPGLDLVTARILADAASQRAVATANVWRPVAMLAACAVVGVMIGLGGALFAPQADAADAALSAAFGDGPELTPPRGAPDATPADDAGVDAGGRE